MIKQAGAFILRPVVAIGIVAALLIAYFGAIYPWFMNWGATAEEQQTLLPGDTLPGGPSAHFTRAITIDAPASTVWSWIIQIGQDRAGFYSNTWLENLGGNDIHNADAVRADWQQRAIGDWVPMARPEMRAVAGDAMYLKIDQLEPGVMINPLPDRFVLRAIDEHTTRLLLRGPLPAGVLGRVSSLQYDPLHFVMEQRMLRGIKERAEGQPLVPTPWITAARVGWALAAVAVLGLFVGRRLTPWLLLPVLFALPAAFLAHDRDAALAAFIGSGTIAWGALLFGSRGRLVPAVIASAALLLSMVAPFGVTLFGAIAWGRRWTAFLLLTCGVLLVFLFSPDAYTTFGVLFDLAAVVAIGVGLNRFLASAAGSVRRLRLQARHI